MMIRFEALTLTGDIFEGYAHNADEARQKVKEQTPKGTEFEVFFGSSAPTFLTLEQFRQCQQMGLPEQIIQRLDQRLQKESVDFDLETLRLSLDVVLEYGLLQREENQQFG